MHLLAQVPNPFDQTGAFGSPLPGTNCVQAIPDAQMGGLAAITAAGAALGRSTAQAALDQFASGLDFAPTASPRHTVRR